MNQLPASAGFGKTTVVSDWIVQNKISAAWFSLDNGDNDPVAFLSYIISGIQSIHPEFGQSALKLGAEIRISFRLSPVFNFSISPGENQQFGGD